jgi:hypothetical protein
MARIAEQAGASVLSDDRVILGLNDDVPTAWGTPWHGSGWFQSERSGVLDAIFLLRQCTETRVTPLSYEDAIKELFVRSIQPRVRGDEVLEAHAALEDVLAAVPAFELHFRPTLDAFALAQAACRR